MTIRTCAPLLILVSGLVGTAGCYHIHRDYHGWQNRRHERRYDRDRYDRKDYRHDDGRHRGWDKGWKKGRDKN